MSKQPPAWRRPKDYDPANPTKLQFPEARLHHFHGPVDVPSGPLLKTRRRSRIVATLAVIPNEKDRASAFGVAFVNPNDNPSRTIGRNIAIGRAQKALVACGDGSEKCGQLGEWRMLQAIKMLREAEGRDALTTVQVRHFLNKASHLKKPSTDKLPVVNQPDGPPYPPITEAMEEESTV